MVATSELVEGGARNGGSANGQCSRGWFERCFHGKGRRCRCACGGQNHGKSGRGLVGGYAPAKDDEGDAAHPSLTGAFRVGDLVKVARPCLGNPADAIAVVYEVYARGGTSEGRSLIFPNGNYDGFSDRDCRLFGLERVGHRPDFASYVFVNVSKLWLDWRAGRFDMAAAGVPA